MQNIGSYLVMKEFNIKDSTEVILEKVKEMFEVNQHFINMYDEDEHTVEGAGEKVYNSQLEEVFYENLKNNISLTELKDLIDKIGNTLVDLNNDEYGDFNIVSIEKDDTITIAISLVIYFI